MTESCILFYQKVQRLDQILYGFHPKFLVMYAEIPKLP